MKRIIFLGIGLLFGGFISAQSVAPEVVGSAGEHFENATYQMDWTVGEVAIETYSNATYTLTQGFHQNTYTVTAIENPTSQDVRMTAYPNPASDFITIENTEDSNMEYSIVLTDINGKTYLIEKYFDSKKKINLSKYSKGIYFINVKSGNKTIKSFKVIKN